MASQPLEVVKTTMAANRGDSFAGALSRIWNRGGVLGCRSFAEQDIMRPLICNRRLPRTHPLGMDRSFHKRRCPSLRCIGGRILRKVIWRIRLRGWYLRWYGGWCCAGICHNGFLHLYEDSGDHTAQDRRQRSQAPQYMGNIHGHLSERGYQGYQQRRQRRCHTANNELGIEIWLVTIGGDRYSESHRKGRQPEAELVRKDNGEWLGRWTECLESTYRGHPSGDAKQDRGSQPTQEPDCRQDIEVYLLEQWNQGSLSWCDAPDWTWCLANHMHGGVGRYVRYAKGSPSSGCY